MRAVVAVGQRHLPRGWSDLGVQMSIWFAFLLAYQVVRGIADRDPTVAFANALKVIDFEQRAFGLYELTAQRITHSSDLLAELVSWTYWNSEFTVISLTMLFVYVRRHHAFSRFRNAILATNLLGLVGYVLMPTAPPRMLPGYGFIDTLTHVSPTFSHESGVIQLASNPYAAMPSLHAADALVVGVMMAWVCRSLLAKALWLIWPAWVWFAVMATANHFWLDVVAGVAVALLGLWIACSFDQRRRLSVAHAPA
jgi:membrane-associated phospholipid phosphatase